jgi:hypothetical protein
MLRQRVSMLMFERMGVPAPRVTHVRVFVNDAYLGLYMLIEPTTHETDAPSLLYAPLDDFFRTLSEVKDSDFEAAVGEFLDLRTIVRYLAVENFIAERGVAGLAGRVVGGGGAEESGADPSFGSRGHREALHQRAVRRRTREGTGVYENPGTVCRSRGPESLGGELAIQAKIGGERQTRV